MTLEEKVCRARQLLKDLTELTGQIAEHPDVTKCSIMGHRKLRKAEEIDIDRYNRLSLAIEVKTHSI